MDRLILMRHAKAERRSASGDDFDRALTEQGRSDAAIMARVLASEGMAPDLALVSGAQRTQETWQAMARTFGGAKAQVSRDLYNASGYGLLEAAEAAPEAKTVLIVAHNPGVHELAISLLIEAGAGSAAISRASGRFPPATAAAFLIDEAGRPSYDGLFYVSDHGGGDGE